MKKLWENFEKTLRKLWENYAITIRKQQLNISFSVFKHALYARIRIQIPSVVMCRNVFVSITSSDIALHPKVPSHLPGSVSTIRWAQRPRLGKQFGMNPQQWLPGSSSHRSSSSGSGTMRQSAMYPQEHAPSLRHDQTPAKDSADMVGTGCCVGVVFPQVNEPPQPHRNLRDPRTQVVHANSAVSTRSRLVIKFTQECEALVAGSY